MTSEHIRNKFFARVDRIAVRLPDDVKEMLFQFAEKNNLLDVEFVKDIVIPFMQSKDGDSTIPSKEEWFKSIENDPPYEVIPRLAEELVKDCPYHAVDSKGQWWCETKKIETEVCSQQFKRFKAMNRRCRPLHRSKTQINTRVNIANVYEGRRIAEEKKLEEKFGYYCYLKAQRFKELSELPCLKDPMTRCQNKKCEEEILAQIKG